MASHVEICCGCGAQAPEHPIVAVVRDAARDGFVHKPVCAACHRDPKHRTTLIKGHFFPRAERARAAALAGAGIVQG